MSLNYSYDGFPREGSLNPELLPCGAKSVFDSTGWRCLDCMAIYGSIACACSSEERAMEKREDK